MTKKISRAEKMRRYMASNPSQTVSQVAAEFGVKYPTAYAVKSKMKRQAEVERRRAKDDWKTVMAASSLESIQDKVSGLTEAQTSDIVMERIAEARRNRAALSEEMLTGIDATLAERGHKYGKFADHAAVTYKLKNVLREHSRSHGKSFAFDQAEALDMICHKLGRIVNGDPDYADSWVDIAGYAKLVADRLETGKTV